MKPLIVLLACACATAVRASPELDQARSAFEARIAEHTKTYTETLTKAGVKYLLSLNNIEAELQQAGDLDGMLAIQTEKKRLTGTPTVTPDDIVESPENLARLQAAYMRFCDEHGRVLGKALTDLAVAYAAHLRGLETELTRAARIEDATEVNRERKTFADSGGVLGHRTFTAVPNSERIVTEMEQASHRALLAAVSTRLKATSPHGTSAPSIQLNGVEHAVNPKSYMPSYHMRAFDPDGEPVGGQFYTITSTIDPDLTAIATAIDTYPAGTIVVVTTRRSPMSSTTLLGALRSVGADAGPGTRPYICVGVKGLRPGGAIEIQGESGQDLHYPAAPTVAQQPATTPLKQPAASPPDLLKPKGGLKRPPRRSGFRRFRD